MASAIAEFIKEPYPGQARKKLLSGCLGAAHHADCLRAIGVDSYYPPQIRYRAYFMHVPLEPLASHTFCKCVTSTHFKLSQDRY